MKTKLLLLAISAAAFSSCSTMYKTGQTPDDVYYSPARTYEEAVQVKKDEDKTEPVTYYNTEDRMIRMGITDSRWRYLDYDYYSYNPYNFAFSYNTSFYNYVPNYNKFYYNDYYYNPYYYPNPVYIAHSSPIKNSTPRVVNLNGYGKNHNNSNAPLTYLPAARPSVKTSATSKLGRILNDVLSPAPSFNQFNQTNTSGRSNTVNTSTERTYTPPATSSPVSSGSSSSGVKISRRD